MECQATATEESPELRTTKEVHSDLLWWFEGLLLGLETFCVLEVEHGLKRIGVKDWTRKMKRHTDRNGMEFESLQESSHDAWIHLYRPNSYSREVQISYYLEGEMAIFCLDAELRKRSKGEYGMDDVMATLYHNHRLDSDNPGITHADIKKALVNTPGGRRLGSLLDSLVGERRAPDVITSLRSLGLDLVSEKKTKGGWLGLNLTNSLIVLKLKHISLWLTMQIKYTLETKSLLSTAIGFVPQKYFVCSSIRLHRC